MIDIYSTYRLIQLMRGVNEPVSFLRGRYAPTNETVDVFDSEKVLAEIKDGDRRLAPFVASYNPSVNMSRPGQRMVEYAPPTIAPSRPITIDDVKKRGFGEALLPDTTPEERAKLMAMTDLEDLSNAIDRRIETIVADVLVNNGCILKPVGDNLEARDEDKILFYEGEENPAKGSFEADWDQPDADIIGDLGTMVAQLIEQGNRAEDFICSPAVSDCILANEEVQRRLDIRNYHVGEAAPRIEGEGAALEAVLNIHGHNINIISYYKTYTGDDGKEHTYLPAGYGVMTAPNALHTLYGSVTQVEQADGEFHTYKGRAIPKFTWDSDGNVRKLTLTSRPLVIPREVNPMVSAKCIEVE